jgi:CRP-like cAMP-binding protein
MLDQLFNYISKRIDLSPEAKKYTESISNLKKVKKGNILIGENESVNKTYFVLQGCLRSYVFDSNGKEHTLQFALKNNWISDYIAIFNNEKSTQTVEAISDSTVIEFSINEGIDNICFRFPEIELIHRKSLERNIVSLQKRILNQLQLSSLERYHLLIDKYPEIEKYALSYHIASYLGITQQSLSRLKAENIK